MNFVLFYHSVVSDWNNGNAHFLRGYASELIAQGHNVTIYEPEDNWSLSNLRGAQGDGAVEAFREHFPNLWPKFYELNRLNIDDACADADVVIVHEWNDPELVRRVGKARSKRRFRLLFHDTHHRCVSAPHEMAQYELRHYDGVLAFGECVRQTYLRNGWAYRAWTWHEAADTRLFRPMPAQGKQDDLVWIGNWGDEERSNELMSYLVRPVQRMGIKATVYGVRYPQHALAALADAGIQYGGWLPNHKVPEVFAKHKVTVHVPRRLYAKQLPGIPTIRPFEALACGIPLISAPWDDRERLFHNHKDIHFVRSGRELERHVAHLLEHPTAARDQARAGLETILAKHTCFHRAQQLLDIVQQIQRPQVQVRMPSVFATAHAKTAAAA